MILTQPKALALFPLRALLPTHTKEVFLTHILDHATPCLKPIPGSSLPSDNVQALQLALKKQQDPLFLPAPSFTELPHLSLSPGGNISAAPNAWHSLNVPDHPKPLGLRSHYFYLLEYRSPVFLKIPF